MGLEFELPSEEEMNKGGGNFITKPGWYHLQVIDPDENPVALGGESKGQPIDGFAATCSLLAGKPDDNSSPEVEGTIRLVFRNPDMSKTDKSIAFARRKQGAYLIATGLVDESKLGGKVKVDLNESRDRQVIAQLEPQEDRDGNPTKFLQLAFANIYHVDDPRGAKCPRDEAALALIPKALRRDPASFKVGKDKQAAGQGGSGSNGNGAAKPAEQPAASGAGVNIDDI